MDVLLQLIDRLDELVRGAKHVPFSEHVRVNKQEIRAVLDELRTAVPGEIKEARWSVQERQDLLSEAKPVGAPRHRAIGPGIV
jgi:hypothetical protein